MKKRVGIITVHNSLNYGASLQAFALYKYIELQGCDCELIDLHRPHYKDFIPSKKYVAGRKHKTPLKIRIKIFIKKMLGMEKKKAYYPSAAKEKIEKFNSQIKMSRAYCGNDDLYAYPPEYDLYITGSDQVWNPTQLYCIEPFFLTFVTNGKPKISYAASIGITELTKKEKKDFRDWLGGYNAISVREAQAKTLLESFTDFKIEQVTDPTFLLDVDFWKSMAVYPSVTKPYILLFTLYYSQKLLNFALRLSEESGFPLIYLAQRQPEVLDNSYTPETNAGIQEFLGYIANASLMITDSFHGTAFSIIMGAKNFYSYIDPVNIRGSRITDLLDTYQLSNHLLSTELQESYSQLESNAISREKVLATIATEQKKGRKFLDKYLTDAK